MLTQSWERLKLLSLPAELLKTSTLSFADTAVEHIQQCRYLVDNKYYTAHLDVWKISTDKVFSLAWPVLCALPQVAWSCCIADGFEDGRHG
jgi:hypothetical protein